MSKYLTAPLPSDRMPTGIPFIVGNEAAERFSFYGMKAILTVFMTQYLLDSSGAKATMTAEQAKFWVHTFVVAGYTFPVFGAILSDWLFGKYRTILVLSVVYCLGHLTLALDETRFGLGLGLGLIALGMGAIKPCVSAHLGDQFGPTNSRLLGRVYGWFYLSINFGAFFSTLLTPLLLDKKAFADFFGDPGIRALAALGLEPGPRVAFGVPGVLMAIATFLSWLGRHRFVHVPPRGKVFLDEVFSREVLSAIARLIPIYLCVAAFWCLFDQTATSWVLQAESDLMDKRWLGREWLSSQLQAVNPAMILVFVPLFSYVIYPAINRVWRLTPIRKIGIGMFLATTSFMVLAVAQARMDAGETVSVGWQVLAYALITAAEVMVSITSLEFSYTQAPPSMKSVVMSVYLLSTALGNEFTAVVNAAIENDDGSTKLTGAEYFWFFAGVMGVAAVAYLGIAMTYRGKAYVKTDDTSVLAPGAPLDDRCGVCGSPRALANAECSACGPQQGQSASIGESSASR